MGVSMAGSGLRAVRWASVRPIVGGLALVAGVCTLFGVVNTAQAPAPVKLLKPTTASPHAYYDALAARPDKARSYSLRNQAQLDDLVKGAPSDFFTYTWPVDDYARKQDAAKL